MVARVIDSVVNDGGKLVLSMEGKGGGSGYLNNKVFLLMDYGGHIVDESKGSGSIIDDVDKWLLKWQSSTFVDCDSGIVNRSRGGGGSDVDGVRVL